MEHATALAVSRELADAMISHTIQVGVHENMIPRVSVNVVVEPFMLRYAGSLVEAISLLADIASRHGLRLTASMGYGGYVFEVPRPGDRVT